MKRNYNECSDIVRNFYRESRTKQTVEYVKRMHQWYESKSKTRYDIWEAIELMGQIVDSSDPDINVSNIHHLFQVAENMRKSGAEEWVQVVGLIHDLGKIMYLSGSDETGTTIIHQWGVVGDTFIVGCPIPSVVVFSEYNNLNPDSLNPLYNTGTGVYKKGCGLTNTLCSWGHDEYLYRVLVDNNVPLAQNVAAMYMIRYHSLYPWHNMGAYNDIIAREDLNMLPFVKQLNKHDLYTKENLESDPASLKAYYLPLLHKYIGTSLLF